MEQQLAITGPTLTLRFPSAHDAAELFRIGSDSETTKYMSWGPYTALEQAELFITGTAGQRERCEELGFVVERDGEILGWTVFSEPRPRDRSVVIGTWLYKDYWGTGVNTESKALMAALAFRALGVERLSVWAAASNERSRGALKKVGFTEEGVLRRFHRHGDEWFDCIVGSILSDEYPSGPLAAVPAQITGEVPANWRFDSA
jgi:ribosomal-protein-alanine N-acetyltransferase